MCVCSLFVSTSHLPPGQTLHLLCAQGYLTQSLDLVCHVTDIGNSIWSFSSYSISLNMKAYFRKLEVQTFVFVGFHITSQKSTLGITLKIGDMTQVFAYLMVIM